MTQPCWANLYFHNTFTIFILNQKRGWAKEGQCVCGALGHQQKCFYFYSLEVVNMFELHWTLNVGLN